MDPQGDFVKYLQNQILQNSPTLKSWAEAHMSNPQTMRDDPLGWWTDSAQQMARDANVTRDPRVSKGVEPFLNDLAATTNSDPFYAGTDVLKQMMRQWKPMEWAHNVAADVGNRTNAASGVGDLASRAAIISLANGSPDDPLSAYARFLTGQQNTPAPSSRL